MRPPVPRPSLARGDLLPFGYRRMKLQFVHAYRVRQDTLRHPTHATGYTDQVVGIGSAYRAVVDQPGERSSSDEGLGLGEKTCGISCVAAGGLNEPDRRR